MPDIDSPEMSDSRFLRKEQCGEEGIDGVIDYVPKENVSLEGEPPKEKWTVYFSNGVKPFVTCKTTRQQIADVLGKKNTDDWTGGKINLYHDRTVMFRGKLHGGIRVRAPRRTTKPAPVRPRPPVPLSQPKSVDEITDEQMEAEFAET